MVYSGNRFLSQKEMKVNAQYIMTYLLGKGWTKNAIAGMLGNMQSESTINPGIWQNLSAGNTRLGYGLVQWTPATKYINWAKGKGLDYKQMDSQLQRILYEVKANIQWMDSSMTFKQFTQSTDSPRSLGMKFLNSYERPADRNQPHRGTQAEAWFDSLNGEGSGGEGGYQLAKFPMDVLYVTQGENSEFSHLDNYWAMDFVGTHKQYPYYAPVDCECIGRDVPNAIAIWKSQKEVMCADGEIRQLTWRCIHDDNLLYYVGDKLAKGELMGHTGNSGESAGDHLHLEVYETDHYDRSDREQYWRHIYDVFSIGGVKVLNDWGYPWIISDYQDGSSGGDAGGNSQKDIEKKMIALLLSDSLHGWK